MESTLPVAAKFTIGEAFGFAWDHFKSHLGFWLGTAFIFVVAAIGGEKLNTLEISDGFKLLISLAFTLLMLVIEIGIIKVSLTAVDGKPMVFSDLFSSYRLFFRFFLSSICYVVIVMFGFLLLIIPGLIWTAKYLFYLYFIVDKNMAIGESFSHSAAITAGQKWNIWKLIIVCDLMNIAGMLVFGLGLFVTLPLTFLVFAYAYRKLLGGVPAMQPAASMSV